MNSILNEFNVFNSCPQSIKQNIKLFHVFVSDFAICVTNDDKVFASGGYYEIKGYFGFKKEGIDNTYVLISELCEQNIQKFFCFKYNIYRYILYAKSSDNKIISSGHNEDGKLARGYQSDEFLKPMEIVFFHNKNIIDISCGNRHCLALSSGGLVYGWGDR